MTTETLTPDAVRALIERSRNVGPDTPHHVIGLLVDMRKALSAFLPREDADLDAIESRAAWAGSYGSGGDLQADVARFKVAREDVPVLLARVRTAEAESARLWRWIEALGGIAMSAGFTGVGLGWEKAIDQAVESAVRGSRTVEAAEEWEYGVRNLDVTGSEDWDLSDPRAWAEEYDDVMLIRRRFAGPSEPVPPTPEQPATTRECGNDSHHGYGTGCCGDCTKEAADAD